IAEEHTRGRLYSEGFRRELQGYSAGEVFRNHARGKEFSDPLALVQYLDYKTYLPGDILTKVDRASMAHSLEVRTPFLDYEFVEWSAQLPAEAKLRASEGKVVLKEALTPVLPREILYRKKMGFAVPLDIWFRGSLREHIVDVVRGSRLADCGIFEKRTLARMVQQHQSGQRDFSAPLWSLLMFEGFLRRHEQAAAPAGPSLSRAQAAG